MHPFCVMLLAENMTFVHISYHEGGDKGGVIASRIEIKGRYDLIPSAFLAGLNLMIQEKQYPHLVSLSYDA